VSVCADSCLKTTPFLELLLLLNTTRIFPKHEGLYRYGRRCGRHSFGILLNTTRKTSGHPSTREPLDPAIAWTEAWPTQRLRYTGR
jgi:hypothetical protein